MQILPLRTLLQRHPNTRRLIDVHTSRTPPSLRALMMALRIRWNDRLTPVSLQVAWVLQ